MKQVRFINTKQSVASYMQGFSTNKVSFVELAKWSQFLGNFLSNNDTKVVAFYGKEELKSLERYDGDLFTVNAASQFVTLNEGKGEKDLIDILSYIDTEVLLRLIKAPREYEKDNAM